MPTRTLSRTAARVVLGLESDRQEVIDLDGIQRRAGATRTHARKIAHDLAAKGWLRRIGRGRYLLVPVRFGPEAAADHDPFRIGLHLATPYYFGYGTAAELLGLLPQAGRTYYVVTPRRGSVPRVPSAEFRRVTVAARRFFGTATLRRRGLPLRVSDVERTILDCLARPDLAGGVAGGVRVLHSAGPRIDWNRLGRYARRFGERSLPRRIGYLGERLAPRVHVPRGWIREFLPRADAPYAPLGPPREFGRRGPHDRRWHLIENVPERVLFGEVEVR